jgi:multidrug efflux pump subunit AcrB
VPVKLRDVATIARATRSARRSSARRPEAVEIAIYKEGRRQHRGVAEGQEALERLEEELPPGAS